MKKMALAILLFSGCSSPAEPLPPGSPTLEAIARGDATIVDLGHALNPANPHWPGEGYEPFSYTVIADLEKDGVFSGAFSTPEHLGTHLDAPNHFEANRPAVNELTLPQLAAPLAVIDIRQQCASDADYQLSVADVEQWEAAHGQLEPGTVVAALTGWDQYWGDYDRYKNADDEDKLHFPGFSVEAARRLVERSAAGLMIDTLSVDYGLSEAFDVHHVSNSAGLYHIENATRLGELPAEGSFVLIAPIKIEGGSGGPARVWAIR